MAGRQHGTHELSLPKQTVGKNWDAQCFWRAVNTGQGCWASTIVLYAETKQLFSARATVSHQAAAKSLRTMGVG